MCLQSPFGGKPFTTKVRFKVSNVLVLPWPASVIVSRVSRFVLRAEEVSLVTNLTDVLYRDRAVRFVDVRPQSLSPVVRGTVPALVDNFLVESSDMAL